MAALQVCVGIAVLFISAFMGQVVSRFVVTLFVIAMVCLIAGLVSLREVHLATRSLRFGPHGRGDGGAGTSIANVKSQRATSLTTDGPLVSSPKLQLSRGSS